MQTLPTLLLLPGLLNDAELWRDQIAALSDVAECRVPDLTQGETLEALAEGVLAGAPPRFALAGFSFGGYVAQEIARLAPERIDRLALLDTAIRVDTPERAVFRRGLTKAARMDGKFQGIADRMLASYIDHSRLSDAELTGRIKSMTQRLGREVFIRQNEIERRDGEAVLRALTCPILILCGENDEITPLADMRAIADFLPGASFVAIRGTGHLTPMEKPEAVNNALRDWLAW
jgi:pimeloyl-ACP methyl ester carboxylesterase